MEMRMSCGHSMRLAQRLSLRLSQAQRLQIHGHALSLRLQLLQELHGERYEPKATCSQCDRKLTPLEIIRGFNQDPTDFTTCCSSCGHRFVPSLICFGNGTQIELPFFCDSQMLAQLFGKEILPSEEFARKHPAIFRAAILYHGGLRQAFAKIGIAYAHEEITDWRSKIAPFLGRMPDTVIAECADVPLRTIRRLRREIGVGKYSLRAALDEAGIEV